MIYDEEAASWRRQAGEMRLRAAATAALAAAWPAQPEQPKRPAPLAVPLRAGAIDWSEREQINRRVRARMALERAVAREAEQTKISEAEHRAEWRSQNSILQIMR
jgi:hypothetical protein